MKSRKIIAMMEDPRSKPFEVVEPEVFALTNRSLYDFLEVEIDPSSNLLGNRWLTREGSLFVVAPSGHGKSSFSIQCAINWALGRVAFGIKPARPLRLLIMESEDDDAENKSFVQIIRTMGLSPEEIELLCANTRLEFRRDLTGDRFFVALDQFLSQYKPDILLINPLTGFCTIELKDEIGMNDFLRNRLNSLMAKHRCAPIIVAHMPKGQVSQIEDKEWYEWMYVLSGCVTLTNWARAILVFVPSKVRGTYRFITAKRPSHSGWLQPEYYFAHSQQTLLIDNQEYELIQWVPAEETQIADAKPQPKQKKPIVSSDLIYAKLSPIEDYTRESWRIWCQETFKMGYHAADDYRSAMVFNGLVTEIEGDGKGAAKAKVFRKAKL
jgi:AAA domain